MTRIGSNPPDGKIDTQHDTLRQQSRDDQMFGKAGHRGAGFGLNSHLGGSDFRDGVADEREGAFLEKMRRAIAERDPGASTESGANEPRLLAIAQGAAVTPHPLMPGAIGSTAPPLLAPDGETVRRVQALGERIEQAVLAEMRGNPAAGLTLDLDLPGGESGLAGISVAMSRDGIEVVLRHSGMGDPAAMAQAAQALAERLQTRFARRTVRISEIETPSTVEPSSGMDQISALLAGRGGRT